MSHPEPDWNLYRTFLAVLRLGSFSAAAQSLGLAQPTPGRHIESLEAALGTALFKRSRRGLTPTPAAQALLPQAEAMATAVAAMQRTCSAEWKEERGVVRLSAGEMMSQEILPPILSEFCRRHRAVELELAVSNRNEDLLARDVDIAVRMARPTQDALVARRVGVFEIGLFAHQDYIKAFGLPETSADLSGHRLIGFDRDARAIHSAGGVAAQLRREHFGFRCDVGAVQIAVLRAGAGIGGHYVHLARRERALVRVLEGAFNFRREVWLAMHRESRTVRRTALLFKHLASSLAAESRSG